MEGFLAGWRAIADFLDVSIQTAKKYYMPVHRFPGGTPIAMPHELRIWVGGKTRFSKNCRKTTKDNLRLLFAAIRI